MTAPAAQEAKDVAKGVSKGVCRCEAHIAPAVLDGYSCGNPECWRTAVARASFAAFVEKLVARRGDAPVKSDAPKVD